ncbi:MAG: hypothetical protein AAGA85_06860 [Bacteroidota bacterium]
MRGTEVACLRHLFVITALSIAVAANAQPNTDVYLFDLAFDGDNYRLSNPTNVSNNPGYDNQPSFSSDGRFLYYTRWQSDLQTDLVEYALASGETRRITKTDGSEYSPTEVPGGDALSTILLERDGTQLLYAVDLAASESNVLVPNKKIGYHCWLSDGQLFSFVLGQPNKLMWHDLKNGKEEVLDSLIGRSLHKVPDELSISYISKRSEPWTIRKYVPQSGQFIDLGPTLLDAEDLTWTQKGHILMGSGQKLYWWSKETGVWSLVADLSDHNISNITRLAVNPSSTQLALVGND